MLALDFLGKPLVKDGYIVYPGGKSWDCTNPLRIGKILDIQPGIKVLCAFRNGGTFGPDVGYTTSLVTFRPGLCNDSNRMNMLCIERNTIPEEILKLLDA